MKYRQGYVAALILLLAMGLCAVWAGYTATATGDVTDIADVADVAYNDFTIGKLWRKAPFVKTADDVFKIGNPSPGADDTDNDGEPPETTNFHVRFVLISASDNAKEFRFLQIKLDLNDGSTHKYGYLSLKNPEVIIDPSGLTTDDGSSEQDPWTVDITVYGLPWKKVGANDITIDCYIEPTTST